MERNEEKNSAKSSIPRDIGKIILLRLTYIEGRMSIIEGRLDQLEDKQHMILDAPIGPHTLIGPGPLYDNREEKISSVPQLRPRLDSKEE